MLGYRNIGTTTGKNKLLEKERIIRNHFICEDILARNNFDHVFLMIDKVKASKAQLWTDLEFYQKIDYIAREVKNGTYTQVAKRFGVSSSIVSQAFHRCLRIELKRYSIENEGIFEGYHGNLSTEEDILNDYNKNRKKLYIVKDEV